MLCIALCTYMNFSAPHLQVASCLVTSIQWMASELATNVLKKMTTPLKAIVWDMKADMQGATKILDDRISVRFDKARIEMPRLVSWRIRVGRTRPLPRPGNSLAAPMVPFPLSSPELQSRFSVPLVPALRYRPRPSTALRYHSDLCWCKVCLLYLDPVADAPCVKRHLSPRRSGTSLGMRRTNGRGRCVISKMVAYGPRTEMQLAIGFLPSARRLSATSPPNPNSSLG